MTVNGSDPAYPSWDEVHDQIRPGMDIRTDIAKTLAAGMLAGLAGTLGTGNFDDSVRRARNLLRNSIVLADEFIDLLNKPEETEGG